MVSDQINLILFIIYVCFGLFLSFIYSLQRDSPKIKFRSILLTLISINFQFVTNIIILLIYLFPQFSVSCNWFYWIGHLLIPNLGLLQFFKLIRLIYLFWLSYIKLKAARSGRDRRRGSSDDSGQVWWKRDKFTRNWIKIRPWFQSPLLVTQLVVQLGFNSVVIVILQLIILKFKINWGVFLTPSGQTQVCSTPVQIYITLGQLGFFFVFSWFMLVALLLMGIKETYGILIELVASLIILPIHLILCIILMFPAIFGLAEDYIINVVYLNWFLSFFMFLIYLVPFIQPNLNLYKNLDNYNRSGNNNNNDESAEKGISKPKLEAILQDPVMFLDFKRFAANHFCVENVLFFERYAKLIQMCNIRNWTPSQNSSTGFGQSLSKLSSIGGATVIGTSIQNQGIQNARELSPIIIEVSPKPESVAIEDEELAQNPIISDDVVIDEGAKSKGYNHLNVNIYNDDSDDNIIILSPDGKSLQIPPTLGNKVSNGHLSFSSNRNCNENDDDDSDILPQFPEFNYFENDSSECVSLATCQKLELKSNNPIIKEIQTMYQDFIHPSSPLQLNLTATTRKQIQQEILKLEKKLTKCPNLKVDISVLEGWSEIYEEVYNTLLLDTFPRYLKFLETVTKSWMRGAKRV